MSDHSKQIDEIFSHCKIFTTKPITNAISLDEAKAKLQQLLQEVEVAAYLNGIEFGINEASALYIETLKQVAEANLGKTIKEQVLQQLEKEQENK